MGQVARGISSSEKCTISALGLTTSISRCLVMCDASQTLFGAALDLPLNTQISLIKEFKKQFAEQSQQEGV